MATTGACQTRGASGQAQYDVESSQNGRGTIRRYTTPAPTTEVRVSILRWACGFGWEPYMMSPMVHVKLIYATNLRRDPMIESELLVGNYVQQFDAARVPHRSYRNAPIGSSSLAEFQRHPYPAGLPTILMQTAVA